MECQVAIDFRFDFDGHDFFSNFISH